jgi:hypothetical protein
MQLPFSPPMVVFNAPDKLDKGTDKSYIEKRLPRLMAIGRPWILQSAM